MVDICCIREETIISPKQSQKTISRKKENLNNVSLNADFESFFGKEEVQTFRKLFISVVILSRNIEKIASEDEIDKQIYLCLREIYNCLV